ncbi:hypothetical protein [Cryptosporangium phraense]|uniref:Uncharacterized protein n=1 Tax=Cryptosporangium phraense TaxID=2593070 RepID=A0A545AKQ5_9ACTN|nr:hypothetical protein [Cryptosporangium phraense]TQS41889.1 hypothetical protein FL583_26770 [Cryptosporangium phraense]
MESNAAEQLTAIADARAAVADRLVTPWWYHPALGALVAFDVVMMSFGNIVLMCVGCVVFLALCVVLANAYRRMTGVWVSGFEAGRAGRWAGALGALVGVSLAASWVLGSYTDLRWVAWLIAAVDVVATIVLGRRFDAALRAQLRAAG